MRPAIVYETCSTAAVSVYKETTNFDDDCSSAPSREIHLWSEKSDTYTPKRVTGILIDAIDKVDDPDPMSNDLVYDTIIFVKLTVADNITMKDEDRNLFSTIPIRKQVMRQSFPGS